MRRIITEEHELTKYATMGCPSFICNGKKGNLRAVYHGVKQAYNHKQIPFILNDDLINQLQTIGVLSKVTFRTR